MVLGLLLAACTRPALPDEARVESSAPPRLVPGRSFSPTNDLVDLGDGVLAGSLFGSVLVRDDGSLTAFPGGSGSVVGVASDSWLVFQCEYCPAGYQLSTGRWGHPVWPVRPVKRARGWEGTLADGTVVERGEGHELVVTAPTGAVQRLRVDLPGDSLDARGLIPLDAGSVAVFWRDRSFGEVLAGSETRRKPRRAADIITILDLHPLQERRDGRILLPRAPVPPGLPFFFPGVSTVVRAQGRLLGVMDQQAGWIDEGGFHPIEELGSVRALLARSDGTVWAGGDVVYRLSGDRWEPILTQFDSMGMVGTNLARDGYLRGVRHGAARPAANAALLFDGDRVCGDPALDARFFESWGDCDDWLAITTSGVVLAGDATHLRRHSPPVGDALHVARAGRWTIVGGTTGVSWSDGGPWRSVPIGFPARLMAAVAGKEAPTVWFAGDGELCHTAGEPPVCTELPAAVGAENALSASPGFAWVGGGGDTVRVALNGARNTLADGSYDVTGVGSPLRAGAVQWDPRRHVVWAVADGPEDRVNGTEVTRLTALDEGGTPLRSYLLHVPYDPIWALGDDGAGNLVLASPLAEVVVGL